MRQAMVAGNWKMNGSRAGVEDLLTGILAGLGDINSTEVVVCPPAVYLDSVGAAIEATVVRLGGQNLCDNPGPGAFTGEVSGAMLHDIGCHYVIVGHSERRSLYGEADDTVAQKFTVAQAAGLVPILCVGELLDEREAGQTETVVARQLDAVINAEGGSAALARAVIAYEPVWAIGTGKTATPEQAQQVHAFIRQRIAEHDADIAASLQILYGGSVKADNAGELFSMPDIDGGLIGGASLKAEEFLAICRAGD
jgi:triosephosphate isomerase